MDEQTSEKNASEKNKSTRGLPDPTDGIQHAKEEGRARHRDGGQSKHYLWGLSWYEFLTVVMGFIVGMAAFLQWYVDATATRRKERPRIISYRPQKDASSPDLSFSLKFKNIGAIVALNTSIAWLQGECQYTSFQECIDWCLQPLRETQGKTYGPLGSQEEYTEEFFSPLETGTARTAQRPIYFCGYVAYTDVNCTWRRQFYVLSYNPAIDQFSHYTLSRGEEEAQAQECHPQ